MGTSFVPVCNEEELREYFAAGALYWNMGHLRSKDLGEQWRWRLVDSGHTPEYLVAEYRAANIWKPHEWAIMVEE